MNGRLSFRALIVRMDLPVTIWIFCVSNSESESLMKSLQRNPYEANPGIAGSNSAAIMQQNQRRTFTSRQTSPPRIANVSLKTAPV